MNLRKAGNLVLGTTLVLSGAAAIGHGANTAESDTQGFEHSVKVEKLSDLKDGETRTFGEGDNQVEAVRSGDVVAITLRSSGNEGSEVKNFSCDVTRDKCTVVTVGGGSPRTMVMVNKSSGDGDRTERTVQKIVIAGEPGDGAVWIEGDGPHDVIENLDELGGPGGSLPPAIAFAHGDQVLLRCPQGDTTMTLTREEAKNAAAYRCPRHSEELKEVKGERRVVRVIHRTDAVKK